MMVISVAENSLRFRITKLVTPAAHTQPPVWWPAGYEAVTNLVTLTSPRGHQIGAPMVTDLVTLTHLGGSPNWCIHGHRSGGPPTPRGGHQIGASAEPARSPIGDPPSTPRVTKLVLRLRVRISPRRH